LQLYSRVQNRPAGHAVAVSIAFSGFGRPEKQQRRRNSRNPASFSQKERSSKMPKMKTKSAAKKRFKITATGKVVAAAAGKRHGMIKRSNKFIRDARGTMVLAEPDGKKVIKNFLPNGL
jgi:large subunit ribosomal protein L35